MEAFKPPTPMPGVEGELGFMPDVTWVSPDWLVPRRRKTFQHFVDKLREAQRLKVPRERQLALIDWWIGRLFELRAKIAVGRRI